MSASLYSRAAWVIVARAGVTLGDLVTVSSWRRVGCYLIAFFFFPIPVQLIATIRADGSVPMP